LLNRYFNDIILRNKRDEEKKYVNYRGSLPMALLNRLILGSLILFASCAYAPGVSAADSAREFRVGLIGADPGRILHDFDTLRRYLSRGLAPYGIRDVSVFVAKDLDQMRARIREGTLDFILTSAFPVLEMESDNLIPSVLALRGAEREYSAVFFVRKESGIQGLVDLKGKTIVFGTPSSTAAYAMAEAELKTNSMERTASASLFAPEDAVRYEFAGEPLNQAFRVILGRADAGAFSSNDWSALPRREQSRLRIIHRTATLPALLGTFCPSFPAGLRDAVEKTMIDMPDDKEGAAPVTKFERLTDEDRLSLGRLQQILFPFRGGGDHEDKHQ
jgi:phosphonate transport system substrate-binding protein